MAEMDIYMRRRLVALGGLVAFFIIFVLLVKSCGGDESEAPITPVGTTGAEGTAALSREEFIAQADAICADANAAVGALDPTDPDATRDEFQITRQELQALQQLEVDDDSRVLRSFMRELSSVVDALQSKVAALRAGDTVAEGEAQALIDESEAEARQLGDRYGFRDCGQFLDAGEAPSSQTGTDATGGAAAPPATDTAPPATDTAPPATDTAPPADTGGAPPPDSGGITP